MAMTCPRCGREVLGNSPVCMNCGVSLPDSYINQQTRDRLRTTERDTHVANNASSVKAFGSFLVIIGIVADVVSMLMISGGSYDGFGTITTAGTICFIIGLMMIRNG